MILLDLFNFPAATLTIAEVGEFSAPWFLALLPVMYVAVGIVTGVLIVIWLKEKVLNGILYLFGGYDHEDEASDITYHYRNPPYSK